MYQMDARVRYSEVDETHRIKLESVLDYFQDCCTFHSEDVGGGLEFLKGQKRAWLLASWQIVIKEYPKLGEQIRITTQACGSEKMFGYRNFMIHDEAGNMVVKAYSIWSLLDMKKGRPCMVQPEDIELYGMEEPLPMEKVSRKIAVPKEGGQQQKGFLVQEYHLDTNHHVNNGQYVRMATAYLPDDFSVREMRVEYRRQAKLGDMIQPMRYELEDGYLVVLQDPEGKIYCVVRFIR